MANSNAGRLEEKAIEFRWVEKRKSGTTKLKVAFIAEEVFEGWDISERILGEDMEWHQPSLADYRIMSDYADMLAAVHSFQEEYS